MATIYEMIEIIREEIIKVADCEEMREGASGQAIKVMADQAARFAAARIIDADSSNTTETK